MSKNKHQCKKRTGGIKLIHKKSAIHRATICGLGYDERKDLGKFVTKNLTGHWKRVTCKRCLKCRNAYEKFLKKINR